MTDLIRRFASPARYIVLSGLIYAYIFFLLWFTDSVLETNPRISYAVILGSAYIIDYTLTGRWVFQKNLNWKTVVRFFIFIIISYVLNVLVFSIIYSTTEIALLSALLVALILFLPRYFLSKKFVYRD
jgi:putative flippase GtrA